VRFPIRRQDDRSLERGLRLNRPEKRNALNPPINARMVEVLEEVEGREDVGVMVLTGSGDSFCAGMDLQEYFRGPEAEGRVATVRVRRIAGDWMRRLAFFEKPTIAMVNGWCFGGAFTPLVSCDLAIAAEEAQFGLSEINWGIIPAGNVTRSVAAKMSQADALYYIMTGETFDGRRASEMRLVNEAVPLAQLKERVRRLANVLLEKNPTTLKIAKDAYRRVRDMPWDVSDDYLISKQEQLYFVDQTQGRKQGMRQFLDDKTYRPGLAAYKRGGKG
jgi:feruloyl-CoA hydratase/lyase